MLPFDNHPIIKRDSRLPRKRGWLARRIPEPWIPGLVTAALCLGVFMLALFVVVLGGSTSNFGDLFEILYISILLGLIVGGWSTGLSATATAGMLIAEEFERHTWDDLAITPLTNTELVMAKFIAALYRLRHWLRAQIVARGIFFGITLVGLLLGLPPLWGDARHMETYMERTPLTVVVALAVSGAFFIAQPLLTAAAGAGLGICCSSVTRKAVTGRLSALTARISTWVGGWFIAVYLLARLYPLIPDDFSVYVFSVQAHTYIISTLIDFLPDSIEGWVIFAGGHLVLAAVALLPMWLYLRAAVAMIGRKRL